LDAQLHALEELIYLVAEGGPAAAAELETGHETIDAIGAGIRMLADDLAYRNRQIAEQAERLKAHAVETDRLNEALARSNKELAAFAHTASHDLREPLRKVTAFGDLLVEDYAAELPAEAADFVRRMQSASRRMSRLITALMAYSQVGRAQPGWEMVDLGVIAGEVVNDLSVVISERNATVEVGVLPVVEGNSDLLRQLLQNLVSNGLKFHRPSVPPVVRVTAGAPRDAKNVRPLSGAPTVELVVADEGLGLDPRHFERAFQPFQRLHPRNPYGGSGIGLATCRKIVDYHRGTLTVHSQLERGTQFVASLPVRQPPPRGGDLNEAGGSA